MCCSSRSSCYTRHHGISGGGGVQVSTDIETVPVVAVSRTHPGSSCVVLVAPPVTQDIMASVGGGDTSIATDIETVPVVAVSRTQPGSSCVVLVAPPVTQDIMVSVGGGIQVSLQILRLFLS